MAANKPARGVAGESLSEEFDFLECPVCFEPILKPSYFVTQYSDGDICNHILCSECAKQQPKCPLCRREVLAVKENEKVDILIQAIIKHRDASRLKTQENKEMEIQAKASEAQIAQLKKNLKEANGGNQKEKNTRDALKGQLDQTLERMTEMEAEMERVISQNKKHEEKLQTSSREKVQLIQQRETARGSKEEAEKKLAGVVRDVENLQRELEGEKKARKENEVALLEVKQKSDREVADVKKQSADSRKAIAEEKDQAISQLKLLLDKSQKALAEEKDQAISQLQLLLDKSQKALAEERLEKEAYLKATASANEVRLLKRQCIDVLKENKKIDPYADSVPGGFPEWAAAFCAQTGDVDGSGSGWGSKIGGMSSWIGGMSSAQIMVPGPLFEDLSKYELKEHIDRSCNEMHLSQNNFTKKVCAKSILVSNSPERPGRDAFSIFREGLLLHNICHPGIVKLYGVYPQKGKICLLLECVSYDLEGVLRGNPAPRLVSGLQLFRRLLLAVHYLHRHQIVHRSLSTLSILMDSARRIKISCFSHARSLHSFSYSGTYRYITPEVIQTSFSSESRFFAPELFYSAERAVPITGSVWMAADVWSVGAIFVEILLRCQGRSKSETTGSVSEHMRGGGGSLPTSGSGNLQGGKERPPKGLGDLFGSELEVENWLSRLVSYEEFRPGDREVLEVYPMMKTCIRNTSAVKSFLRTGFPSAFSDSPSSSSSSSLSSSSSSSSSFSSSSPVAPYLPLVLRMMEFHPLERCSISDVLEDKVWSPEPDNAELAARNTNPIVFKDSEIFSFCREEICDREG